MCRSKRVFKGNIKVFLILKSLTTYFICFPPNSNVALQCSLRHHFTCWRCVQGPAALRFRFSKDHGLFLKHRISQQWHFMKLQSFLTLSKVQRPETVRLWVFIRFFKFILVLTFTFYLTVISLSLNWTRVVFFEKVLGFKFQFSNISECFCWDPVGCVWSLSLLLETKYIYTPTTCF